MLAQKVDKVEITKAWNQNFTMAIKGVIDPAVNGGIEKYKEAFFSEVFEKEASEEEKPLLQEFIRSIKEQIDILDRALRLHEKLIPENMNKLHSALVSQFELMKQKNQFVGIDSFSNASIAIQEPEDSPTNSSSFNFSSNLSSITPLSSLNPSPNVKNSTLEQENNTTS